MRTTEELAAEIAAELLSDEMLAVFTLVEIEAAVARSPYLGAVLVVEPAA